MTIRDLTPQQIRKLQQRCEKDRKGIEAHMKRITKVDMTYEEIRLWNWSFDKGLKAGLEIPRP